MLQEKLHALGDKLSNDEFDGLPDPEKIVDEALAELRKTWLRQLSPRKEDSFKLQDVQCRQASVSASNGCIRG